MTAEEVLQRHLLLVDSKESQQPSHQEMPDQSPASQDDAMMSSLERTPVSHHGNSEEGMKSKEKRKLSVREIVKCLKNAILLIKYYL